MISGRNVGRLTLRKRGFTLIELMIVIAIIAIIASIAIPSLLAARKHGQEAAAIGALRTINTQEVLFRDGDKEQDGNNDFGMLSELSNTGLVDSVLGSGTKQGYFFLAAYSASTSEFLWFGTANPALPGSTGDRYFECNTAGVIYYTTGASLAMDTNTCTIPNTAANSVIPIGK